MGQGGGGVGVGGPDRGGTAGRGSPSARPTRDPAIESGRLVVYTASRLLLRPGSGRFVPGRLDQCKAGVSET